MEDFKNILTFRIVDVSSRSFNRPGRKATQIIAKSVLELGDVSAEETQNILENVTKGQFVFEADVGFAEQIRVAMAREIEDLGKRRDELVMELIRKDLEIARLRKRLPPEGVG